MSAPAAPKSQPASGYELRLPPINPDTAPAASFARRAVTWTTLAFLLLASAALVVAATVRFRITVKGSGTLEPAAVWPVRARTSGIIDRVLVESGARVSGGQAVALLDTALAFRAVRELEARERGVLAEVRRASAALPLDRLVQEQQIAAADARVLRARARLRESAAEVGLSDSVDALLRSYQPGHHVALDLVVADVRAAEAEAATERHRLQARELDRMTLARTRSQLDELVEQVAAARESLRRSVLVSPTRGIVLTDHLEQLAGAVVREGETVIEVGDPLRWRASVLVSEMQVYRVELGQRADLRVQAFQLENQDDLAGRVVYVSPEPVRATTTGAQATQPASAGAYRVILALDPREAERLGLDRLRRGYSVEARIVTRSGNALQLLWHALRAKLRP